MPAPRPRLAPRPRTTRGYPSYLPSKWNALVGQMTGYDNPLPCWAQCHYNFILPTVDLLKLNKLMRAFVNLRDDNKICSFRAYRLTSVATRVFFTAFSPSCSYIQLNLSLKNFILFMQPSYSYNQEVCCLNTRGNESGSRTIMCVNHSPALICPSLDNGLSVGALHSLARYKVHRKKLLIRLGLGHMSDEGMIELGFSLLRSSSDE